MTKGNQVLEYSPKMGESSVKLMCPKFERPVQSRQGCPNLGHATLVGEIRQVRLRHIYGPVLKTDGKREGII